MAERKLIYADELDAEMQKAQESLESNSDHVWELNKGHHAGIAWARRLCADAPAVDATPVAHARWEINHGMINPKYKNRKRCSRCGDISPSDMCCREMLTDYCPNCGAKMDGGAEG